MSSGSSLTDARQALEGYLEGRTKAERVVVAVAQAYYTGPRIHGRERLQPVLEVIERAAPGIVALGRIEGGAGFEIKLAERPFPKSHEAALRVAAGIVLQGNWEPTASGEGKQEPSDDQRGASSVQDAAPSKPGLFSRIIGVVRRLFSASA